ncbi:PepSY-associated TM helix domain-containing protein [Massilia sp. PAMC28688]|uniref:PepSY-associated TM helix domain-containing protein n=1 Tax=Massilia sp. PAMC28688 TaxID=2861283 RepID=UPI001C62558E|nr:PepSY-associated TM helix domain-containing protein [Massilia sp. PAMC28688]QYF92279.1 PepSY-associated TM helix domain-containing protein [Massilia sp. PAMC28688]
MPTPTPHIPSASRAIWLKNLHRWHWISAALSLLGMLMFSVTGITLNHAAQIEAAPKVVNRKATLPAPLAARLAAFADANEDARKPLPPAIAGWVPTAFDIKVDGLEAEWSDGEAYIPLPRPGGDGWLRLSADGSAEYEVTSRGTVSWLNDLHKGRNTGPVWSWFIDIFAGACIVFSLTGFLIMKLHAANRPSTWPVIGFGILVPVLLALLFTH